MKQKYTNFTERDGRIYGKTEEDVAHVVDDGFSERPEMGDSTLEGGWEPVTRALIKASIQAGETDVDGSSGFTIGLEEAISRVLGAGIITDDPDEKSVEKARLLLEYLTYDPEKAVYGEGNDGIRILAPVADSSDAAQYLNIASMAKMAQEEIENKIADAEEKQDAIEEMFSGNVVDEASNTQANPQEKLDNLVRDIARFGEGPGLPEPRLNSAGELEAPTEVDRQNRGEFIRKFKLAKEWEEAVQAGAPILTGANKDDYIDELNAQIEMLKARANKFQNWEQQLRQAAGHDTIDIGNITEFTAEVQNFFTELLDIEQDQSTAEMVSSLESATNVDLDDPEMITETDPASHDRDVEMEPAGGGADTTQSDTTETSSTSSDAGATPGKPDTGPDSNASENVRDEILDELSSFSGEPEEPDE